MFIYIIEVSKDIWQKGSTPESSPGLFLGTEMLSALTHDNKPSEEEPTILK